MKNKKITSVVLLGLILTGFKPLPALAQAAPAMEGHEHHHHAGMTAETSPAPLEGHSLYHMDSTWKNQNNLDTPFATLRGHPLVLSLVYTSCQYVCPMIVSDMKKIEAKLTPAQLQHTKFVIVSIDPDRDTPAQLKSFAKKRALDESRWVLLTGKPDQVFELANMLGVKYKKDSNGDFSHSNIVHIVNAEGVVKYQQVGTNVAPDESLKVLKGL